MRNRASGSEESPDFLRRLLGVLSLALAAAALVWALVLAFVSGFEFTLFGRTITTNEPLRPLAVTAAGLTIAVLAHGVESSYRLWVRLTSRLMDRSMALALATIVGVGGVAYNTTAASGPDQYGYVSQADLWIAGDLRVPQPWAEHVPWPNKRWSFAPLGYRPVEEEGRWENVPTYSPGLPLLMAAAKAIGGQEAMFLVVPLLGALLVLTTWGIGCRLGSSRAGLIAAYLVATSPAFLLHVVVPMSDVPAAAAWALAVFCLMGGGLSGTMAAGVAAGVALLIRPNLLPLAGILGLYAVGRSAMQGRQRLAAAAAFGAPVLVAVGTIAAIYQSLYGSPFVSGYGRLTFAWSHVLPNLRNYLAWFVETQTLLGLAGLAAVFVPLRRFWPALSDRRVLVLIAALVFATWAQYLGYLVFEHFRYLRFLLATWPFVMLGLASVALAFVRLGRPGVTLATAGVVLALGIVGWRDAARAGAFSDWRSDRRFVAAGLLARDMTPPNSAVFAMIHSGSLRYYGGRMTIRYDFLDPDWLDRGVSWLQEHGVAVYALLEDWELEPFAAHFPGQRLVAALDAAPVAVYGTSDAVRLYDLSARQPDAPPAPATVVAPEGFRGALRSVPPAPAPALMFAR